METTERDIRNFIEKPVEQVETETKVEVFPKPSIEFTITPPKHEPRVLKKAEKPTTSAPSYDGYVLDVYSNYEKPFELNFSELKPITFNITEDKIIQYPGSYSVKTETVEPRVDILKKDTLILPQKNTYEQKYYQEYNVKGWLLKDNKRITASNVLKWNENGTKPNSQNQKMLKELQEKLEKENKDLYRRIKKQQRNGKINCCCR